VCDVDAWCYWRALVCRSGFEPVDPCVGDFVGDALSTLGRAPRGRELALLYHFSNPPFLDKVVEIPGDVLLFVPKRFEGFAELADENGRASRTTSLLVHGVEMPKDRVPNGVARVGHSIL